MRVIDADLAAGAATLAAAEVCEAEAVRLEALATVIDGVTFGKEGPVLAEVARGCAASIRLADRRGYAVLERLDAAEAEVARLRAALEKYGQHAAGCAVDEHDFAMLQRSIRLPHTPAPACTCGLDAALSPPEGGT